MFSRGNVVLSVRNKFGIGIPMASVILLNRNYFCCKNTDNSGVVIFDKMNYGYYILIIKRPGYKTVYKLLRLCNCCFIIKIKIKQLGDRVLYGKITDKENNLPIENACVVLYAKTSEVIPVKYSSTDKFGEYYFNKLPSGTYVIKSIK